MYVCVFGLSVAVIGVSMFVIVVLAVCFLVLSSFTVKWTYGCTITRFHSSQYKQTNLLNSARGMILVNVICYKNCLSLNRIP